MGEYGLENGKLGHWFVADLLHCTAAYINCEVYFNIPLLGDKCNPIFYCCTIGSDAVALFHMPVRSCKFGNLCLNLCIVLSESSHANYTMNHPAV